jgi:hypothetical protein
MKAEGLPEADCSFTLEAPQSGVSVECVSDVLDDVAEFCPGRNDGELDKTTEGKPFVLPPGSLISIHYKNPADDPIRKAFENAAKKIEGRGQAAVSPRQRNVDPPTLRATMSRS